jgi:hypothetical protein
MLKIFFIPTSFDLFFMSQAIQKKNFQTILTVHAYLKGLPSWSM